MAFRGRPIKTIPPLTCWCGGAVVRNDFGGGDIVLSCDQDVFHHPVSALDRTVLL